MRAHRVAVFSDVHFPNEHLGGWAAFRQWHRENNPALSVCLGDVIDLAALSVYAKEKDQPAHVIPEIRKAVGQLNELSTECGRLYMVPGNHEARWEKAVIGNNAPALWGAVGLSLREQFYGQGLSPDIKWVSESLECEGLYIGKGKTCLVRHGDKQAGRYGIKQVATAALRRDPNISTVVGHHHRLQMMVQTIKDETRKGLTTRNVVGLANPHLSGPHGYVGPSPDWQIGFTVLEFYGASRLRDCTRFTPVPILMDDLGRFCYGGKVYGV